MSGRFLFVYYVILHAVSLQGKTVNQKPLRLKPLSKCTYDYEVTVYTARGEKSTHSDGYQVHALVSIYSFSLKASDLIIKYSLIPISCTISVKKCSNFLHSPCWLHITSPLSIFVVIVMLRCVTHLPSEGAKYSSSSLFFLCFFFDTLHILYQRISEKIFPLRFNSNIGRFSYNGVMLPHLWTTIAPCP